MNTKRFFAVFAVVIVGSFWGASDELRAQCATGDCGVVSNVASTGGPGTEMTQIINRFGLGSDCGRCKALAAEMDQGGSQWVRQNFNYVVGRTVSNAEALGHNMGPIRKTGVRLIVRRSIQRAR